MTDNLVTVSPSNMVIKISAVHHKKVAYHACVQKLTWVREGLLRPIPLTDDFFVKNGFVYHEGEKGMYGVTLSPYYQLGDSFKVWCDGSHYSVWLEDAVDIEYVHQLQQFLRLSKIKKEIVL